jgi:hypothetical protein
MKLTNLHTDRHLTQTVLQLTLSLHSVTVSYLCNLTFTTTITTPVAVATQVQTMMHQLLLAQCHSTHSLRDKLKGTRETVSGGATSGVFLRYCGWHGLVTVLAANRWQRKALAAGTLPYTDGNSLC